MKNKTKIFILFLLFFFWWRMDSIPLAGVCPHCGEHTFPTLFAVRQHCLQFHPTYPPPIYYVTTPSNATSASTCWSSTDLDSSVEEKTEVSRPTKKRKIGKWW